jgi:hypothetical protein
MHIGEQAWDKFNEVGINFGNCVEIFKFWHFPKIISNNFFINKMNDTLFHSMYPNMIVS